MYRASDYGDGVTRVDTSSDASSTQRGMKKSSSRSKVPLGGGSTASSRAKQLDRKASSKSLKRTSSSRSLKSRSSRRSAGAAVDAAMYGDEAGAFAGSGRYGEAAEFCADGSYTTYGPNTEVYHHAPGHQDDYADAEYAPPEEVEMTREERRKLRKSKSNKSLGKKSGGKRRKEKAAAPPMEVPVIDDTMSSYAPTHMAHHHPGMPMPSQGGGYDFSYAPPPPGTDMMSAVMAPGAYEYGMMSVGPASSGMSYYPGQEMMMPPPSEIVSLGYGQQHQHQHPQPMYPAYPGQQSHPGYPGQAMEPVFAATAPDGAVELALTTTDVHAVMRAADGSMSNAALRQLSEAAKLSQRQREAQRKAREEAEIREKQVKQYLEKEARAAQERADKEEFLRKQKLAEEAARAAFEADQKAAAEVKERRRKLEDAARTKRESEEAAKAKITTVESYEQRVKRQQDRHRKNEEERARIAAADKLRTEREAAREASMWQAGNDLDRAEQRIAQLANPTAIFGDTGVPQDPYGKPPEAPPSMSGSGRSRYQDARGGGMRSPRDEHARRGPSARPAPTADQLRADQLALGAPPARLQLEGPTARLAIEDAPRMRSSRSNEQLALGAPPQRLALANKPYHPQDDLAGSAPAPRDEDNASSRALLSPDPTGSANGLVGLTNLGNTCFMNAALQCLRATPSISRYFVYQEHVHELNKRNRMKGRLAAAYGDLLAEMHGQSNFTSIAPTEFKNLIGQWASQFVGYAQQDSQEFLRFLLDGLHEDLNRVRTPAPPRSISNTTNQDDDALFHKFYTAYTERNDSFINDVFCGWMRSSVVCRSCNSCSVNFEPFLDLSVPLPKPEKRRTGGGAISAMLSSAGGGSSAAASAGGSTGQVSSGSGVSNGSGSGSGSSIGRSVATSKASPANGRATGSVRVDQCNLDDCMRLFTADELLDGDERHRCDTCNARRTSTKSLGIWRFPEVLVVHLKRFQYNVYAREKMTSKVCFPLRGLDLSEFAVDSQCLNEAPIYDLVAVTNHMGSLSGGHYTAYALNKDDGRWYSFNDARVSSLPESEVVSNAAYVLFYRLRHE